MQIDHICHNDNPDCQGGVTCLHRRCGNPIHIEAATSRVNTLRGKGVGAQNASVTHCPKDHPYDEENTSRSGVGRRCKTCDRERARNPRISAERESIDRAVRALYEAHGGRPNGRQVSVALAESGLLDALGALTETQIRAITWWSLRRIEQAEPELAMKYPSQRKSRGVSA